MAERPRLFDSGTFFIQGAMRAKSGFWEEQKVHIVILEGQE